jgi:dienelactone hydrolase
MKASTAWPPDGWAPCQVKHGGHEHAYYVIDRVPPQTPSVLLMHEFPGISPDLRDFADKLADEFRVVVPSIFGRDGTPSKAGTAMRLCIRREVTLLRAGRTSRALDWLRPLLDSQVSRGKPCGVIGMCMTGGFALVLAVNPSVRAAVVAQPAVPVGNVKRLRLPGRARSDLGLTEEVKAGLAARVADEGSLCVRGYRFEQDLFSPPEKLKTARSLLGDTVMKVVPLSTPNPEKHSTLTGDCKNDEAVAEVIAFLQERLGV